ncbi:MAG: hypothetical protein JOZ41_20115 [Chloroflexi bacterium]|nr:hypothetical protein [Chloroflexota bacterium]
MTAQQTTYGSVLFTAGGKALYMLTYDTVGTAGSPAKSSCTGRCPGAWPPLLAPGPYDVVAQGGVRQSGLGTFLRPDGTYQVTYFGWPLYMFVNDKSAGQTTGENVGAFNGLWHLMSISGQPAPGVATVMTESSPEGTVLAAPTAFSTYRSLYNLTTDPPNMTTCTGGCARFWPPLLTTGKPVAGAGADPNGLGTIQRPDGTTQATYFGWPVYMYAFDLGPGAKSGLTNGEDSIDPFNQGIWYLLTPAGKTAPAPATVDTVSTSLGTVLSWDKSPLYMFSADTPAASACTGVCARAWTPLLTNTPPTAAAGSGVNGAGLGTIQRPDGTLQVTYNGHPLYTFAWDYAGTSGQGLKAFGGTFSLMQASGTTLQTVPTTRSVVAIPGLTTSASGMSGFFIVAFTSKNPGQGMVLFGPGPGCTGLVETGTQDQGAGTTNHELVVTGNDLPGSTGDVGVQPGQTYSFEVVTASSSGQETDNNSGACYTVTIPSG